jgi:hypothetical protein
MVTGDNWTELVEILGKVPDRYGNAQHKLHQTAFYRVDFIHIGTSFFDLMSLAKSRVMIFYFKEMLWR